MATVKYKIVRCPHCNKKLEKRSMSTKYPGSPFRSCSKCGMEYIDTDYYEPAIEGIKPDKDYISYLVLAPVLLVVGFVLRGIRPVFFGFSIFFCIVFSVAGLIGLVKHLTGADKRECEQHLEDSKKRLQNPAYALKLKAADYKIPPEYDPTAKPTTQATTQATPRPTAPKPTAQAATPKKAEPSGTIQTRTNDAHKKQSEFKYCRKCGTKIRKGIGFCPKCGTSQ